jgi:hypothetical protein
MAGIDYSIPGQFKGIQIESPINAMTQAMQLRALQESSQMNALKTQEYQRGVEQKNALARIYADPKLKIGSPEFLARVSQDAPDLYNDVATRAYQQADLIEKTNKRKLDESALKSKITQEDLERSIAHITSFRDLPSIYADLDKRVASGELDPAQADQMRNTLPPDETGLLDWKRNLHLKLLNAKDRLDEERKFADRTQPKPEKIEQNGQISFIDMNPNSPTYGRPTGPAEAITDKTPKWTARDIGGSITYVDENQNSPTFGQQKANAAITKTVAPTAVTESPLAKLVREREALPKDSPLLKKYDEAIDKETGGAPPALVQEYLYAQKNNGFKGTLLDFKKQVAIAGRPVSYTSSTPTLAPAAIDMSADRFLTDGTLPSGISKPNRDAIMNRAAVIAKEKGISPDRVSQLEVTANKQALGQLSRTETMVGAFEKNFVKNVKIVENLNKKRDSTGVPLLQKWINVGKKAGTGDPDLAAINVAIKAVVNEYGKIVSGSMGNTAVAVSEIKRMEDLLNAAQNPEDVQAVLNVMRAETKNRMEGFREQRAELVGSMRSSTTAPAAKSDVRSKADAILGK